MMDALMAFLATPEGQAAAIAAAGIVGGLVVKITPTKTDDKWWAAIKGAVVKKSKEEEK